MPKKTVERLTMEPFPIAKVGVLATTGSEDVRQLAKDYLRLRHLIMWGNSHLRPADDTEDDKVNHQSFQKEARRVK